MRRVRTLVVGLAAATLVTGPAAAQGPRGGAADPPAGGMETLLGDANGLGVFWYASRPVRGQPARLGLTRYQLGAPVPLWEGEKQGLVGTVSVDALGARTAARLPDDRVRFPGSLWDVQFGGTYYRTLANGWDVSAGVTVGSASDKPFAGSRETAVTATGTLRKPDGDRDAWLLLLTLQTAGQGAGIPIPGVAYEFRRGPLEGTVGFPFTSLKYRLGDRWDLALDYSLLTNVRAQANYRLADGVRLYGAFAWDNQSWLRAGRRDRNELFNLFEKKVEGGLVWAVGRHLDLQLAGGYAFDRYFAENKGFSLGGRNRVDVGDGAYVSARLVLNY